MASFKYWSLLNTRLKQRPCLSDSSSSSETRCHCIKLSDSLQVAIQEVRRISHHMHPQILDELGLSDAIESIAGNDFSKSHRPSS